MTCNARDVIWRTAKWQKMMSFYTFYGGWRLTREPKSKISTKDFAYLFLEASLLQAAASLALYVEPSVLWKAFIFIENHLFLPALSSKWRHKHCTQYFPLYTCTYVHIHKRSLPIPPHSHGGDALAGFRVPEDDRLLVVLASRDQQVATRVPVHTLHVSAMTCQHGTIIFSLTFQNRPLGYQYDVMGVTGGTKWRNIWKHACFALSRQLSWKHKTCMFLRKFSIFM